MARSPTESRSRLLDSALWLAPVAALICTAASWAHFAVTGGVGLQVWPLGATLVWTRFVAAIGIAVLGLACVLAYRAAENADLKRVLRISLLVHGVMLLALPLYSTDLFSYLAYGELSARGLDPKVHGPAALVGSPLTSITQWQNTPSVYGPVADWLMAIAGYAGQLTGSPIWIAGATYKVIVAVFDIGSLLLAHRLTARVAQPWATRGFVLFALNPLLAWEVAGQAHNDGLVVFAALVYLWAIAKGSEALGVVSLVLGTLAKFVLGPTLALHLWAQARIDLKRAIAMGALALVVVIACFLPSWSPDATLATYLPPLRQSGTLQDGTSIYSVLWKAMKVAGADEGAHVLSYRVYGWFGRLIVLALVVTLLRRVKSVADVPHATLLFFVGVLSTSAVIAPWYLPWLLPFALLQRDKRWQDFVLAFTVVAAPCLGISGLWLVLPLAQLAGLAALWRWRSPVASGAGETSAA